MQVGKLNMISNLKETQYDRAKSPTDSQNSRTESLFGASADLNNAELTSALQGLNLSNSIYNGELGLFNSSKTSVDSVTANYNAKLADLNSAQHDCTSATTKIDNLSNTIDTIKKSVDDTKKHLGNYSGEIAQSQNTISALNNEINATEQESLGVQNQINDCNKPVDTTELDSAVSQRSSLSNNISLTESAITDIDKQIAATDSNPITNFFSELGLIDPLASNIFSGSNKKALLMSKKNEMQNTLAQLNAEKNSNEEKIAKLEKDKTVKEADKAMMKGQLDGKLSILQGKSKSLQANKKLEESVLANTMGKKSIADKEVGFAQVALQGLDTQLQLAEQEEVKTQAKYTTRKEEFSIMENSFSNASNELKSKQDNVDRAENDVALASDVFGKISERYKANRK